MLLQAAKIRYPELFVDVDEATETWILDSMRTVLTHLDTFLKNSSLLYCPILKCVSFEQVRPVVETGYENILLVRLLLEIKAPHHRKSSVRSSFFIYFYFQSFCIGRSWSMWLQVAEKLSIDDILADWEHGIKPVVMKEWNENDKEELVELFGKVRDDWIEHDLHGWIGANRCALIIISCPCFFSLSLPFYKQTGSHMIHIFAGFIQAQQTPWGSHPQPCTLWQQNRFVSRSFTELLICFCRFCKKFWTCASS